MNDKRHAIAIFLCIVVVMVYTELVIAPKTRQAQDYQRQRQQEQLLQQPQQPTAADPQMAGGVTTPSMIGEVAGASVAPRAGNPSPAELEAAGSTVIDSPLFRARVTHLGGRFESFLLKHYPVSATDEQPLDMVHRFEGGALPMGVYAGTLSDAFTTYAVEVDGATLAPGQEVRVPETGEVRVALIGELPGAVPIRKTFVFRNNYLFEVIVQLARPVADGSNVWLEWTYFIPNSKEDHRLNQEQFTILEKDGDLNHTLPGDVREELRPAGSIQWASLNDKYFLAALVPSAEGINSRIGQTSEVFRVQVAGSPVGGTFHSFVGPKDYQLLKGLPFNLERSVDLGIFSFLAYPLLWAIRVFYQLFGNYGLAIILLTLLIKWLFLPLTKASLKSMKAMQDLQPEMKALRERIKDPTQLNQEMMALYRRRGVNPMGGCFPVLIQLPVFLGLYNALLYSIEMRGARFALWIDDLSRPEALMVFGLPVPVMVLIMGASMFIQQYMTPSAADPAQRKVMLLVPVIFTVMFLIYPFPAGLVLYWLVNNLISIVQQQFMRDNVKVSPGMATAFASITIFATGYILTLL